mgnify:CR=1 FL=1
MDKLIQEVIDFLIDNEQYGDDWEKHIDAINKLLNQNKEDENTRRKSSGDSAVCN